jgi:hypothetical protein
MITVITSITGGKDGLIDNQQKGDALFKAYVDESQISDTWKCEGACTKFNDNRVNSRIHKILIHKYADTEYSIWIDGNIKLLKTPEELIEMYMKDHDLAVYKHPVRDCIYDEATVCAKRGLDDPEVIIEQAVAYEMDGYAKHKGLCECGVIIRRHTNKVERFNNAWWAEYTRYSKRDQISFMYAVDKVGLRINAIDEQFVDYEGKFIRGAEVEIIPHVKMTTKDQ